MNKRPTISEIKKGEHFFGSDADVFCFEDVCYRLTSISYRQLELVSPLVGKKIKHVVNVLDAWVENKYLIIKMERLNPLNWEPYSTDESQDLFDIYDTFDIVEKFSSIKIRSERMRLLIEATVLACKELRFTIFDIGPHNTMIDPKTGELKIIDLW